jgi:putative ABC transport system substrate-binding protein
LDHGRGSLLLLSNYGVDLRENWRRAAIFVDRILKVEKPGDIPIEFPSKLEVVVNQKTAHQLGIKLPSSLLAAADDIIE